MNRKIRTPAISFLGFMRSKGVSESDLPDDIDIAKFIGGMLTERTRHGRGKLKKPGRKIVLAEALNAEYKKAIDSGEIAMIETEVPLDMNDEADQAYVRAMNRRSEALKDMEK